MFQTASTTTTKTKTWCTTTIIGTDNDPLLLLSKTNQLMTDLNHDFVLKEEKEIEKSTMTLDKYKKDIDEFFNYTDLLSTLREYYNAYQHYFKAQQENKMDLQKIKEQLEQTKKLNDRLILVQTIAYITLGSFCENDDNIFKSDKKFMESMMTNNELMNDESEWMNLLFKLFLDEVHKNESTAIDNHEDDVGLHGKLIDTYLTILYLLVITSESLEKKLILNQDENIPAKLLSILAVKDIPLHSNKKFLLLLYKVLIMNFGDTDQIKLIKDQIRPYYNLPPVDHGKSFKSTPNDLYNFQYEIKDKYTDYQLSSNTVVSSTTTAITLSKIEPRSLSEHPNPIKQLSLPFQYNFPPKLKSPPTSKKYKSTTTSTIRKNIEDDPPSTIEFKKRLEKKQSKTPFVLGTPKAIEEAGQLYISSMDLSISQYQIIQEHEKLIKKQEMKKMEMVRTEEQQRQYSLLVLNKLEQFYSSVVQNLPNMVTTLLEQLVTLAPTPSSPTHQPMGWGDSDSTNEQEYADTVRNRQIIRTTVSSILILLLKWFKTSHVMKFEYLSQLLVDSGYLMLSIRSFMIEDFKTINQLNSDNENFGFFSQLAHINFNHEDNVFSSSTCSSSSSFSVPYSWEDSSLQPTAATATTATTIEIPPFITNNQLEQKQENDDLDSLSCNQRNKDWILNTLRILQMLTKGKPLRNRTLANYKAFIPLKRITKYNKNSMEELYALKVLKSQVRYLGHKWREANMKTISAISRQCPMNLRDDWLSLCDDDDGDDDDNNNNNNSSSNYNELKLETNMRMIVKLYHERQYDVHILTTVGQYDHRTETNITENGGCNGSDDDDDDDTTYRCWDTGATIDNHPLLTTAITKGELAERINQLFRQPLKRRLKLKSIIQVPFETDGWDAPTPATTTTGAILSSKNKNKGYSEYEDDDDIDTDDEEDDENMNMNGKNKNDPLENIDWNNLTEDELNARMSLVGEQTEQRWLNIDLDDPAYCKVLLDVETEVDEEIVATANTPRNDLDVDPWSS